MEAFHRLLAFKAVLGGNQQADKAGEGKTLPGAGRWKRKMTAAWQGERNKEGEEMIVLDRVGK